MLLIIHQFVIQRAVKNALYLLNPPIISSENAALPRYGVLHYLDNQTKSHFPSKQMPYFRDVPKNKRIGVTNITDLNYKDDVSIIENKQANLEAKKWLQANLKDFRVTDLIELPNTDTTNLSVFNYGLLTDLYKYKSSPLSKHFKFQNLYKTYHETVKKAIDADKESFHFLSIELPSVIPSYVILDNLIRFNSVKFSRVVSDENLIRVLDLYRWLSIKTRDSSAMSCITDNDSKRIVIEFKHKGYSVFLPLHVLISLSEESSLESQSKYNITKVRKLLIIFFYKIHEKVNELISGIEVSQVKTEEETSTTVDAELDQDEDTDIKQGDDTDVLDSTSSVVKTPNKLDVLKEIKKTEALVENSLDSNFNKLLDINIANFDVESQDLDKIYEESMNKTEEVPETQETPLVVDYDTSRTEVLLKDKTLDNKFTAHLADAVKFNTLTSLEIRNLKKLKEQRKSLKSPYSSDETLDDYKLVTNVNKELTPEITRLNIDNSIVGDDLKKEVINNFDKLYINTLLKKDIIANVSNLEKSGLIIKEYIIEENKSSLGRYEVHQLTVKPINGKESKIYFRIPTIDDDGTFSSGNIIYRMRKTKQPLPIVKVSHIRVALTSNYSKLFVSRTERKTNNLYSYIVEHIKESYLNQEGTVVKLTPGIKSINNLKLPNIYSALAREFNEVSTKEVTILLQPSKTEDYIKPEVNKDILNQNLLFCGYLSNKNILVINKDDEFFDYTNKLAPLGTIDQLLNIDPLKLPKPFTVLKVLGDDIPLGVCMSYYLGLNNLIAVTQTKYKIIESSKRYTPEKNELILRFEDYKLILETDTKDKQLLFNGFLFYRDFISKQNLSSFNTKEVYLNVFEFRDSGLIHIKELNLLEEIFLDPITVDVLTFMKEPTDFLKLLLRANNLLTDLSHPDINDPNYSRIRGYDRVPGLIYRALCESLRDYKLKGRPTSKIELDPYKVWNYITQDNTVKITEDVNPILNLKEVETVTLSGIDGLNKDATPKMLRRYHKNEIGLTSEGTVDSSDVALNTYLTPYAKIKDLRGFIDQNNREVLENKSKAFSTSAMLCPGIEHDSAARVNFVQIQNGHTIGSSSYTQPLLRTGYEYVTPYKVGKLYCVMAEQDGSVVDITDKLLRVQYKDKSTYTFKIGKQYGRMEGGVYPHNIVSTVKAGSKFKAGEPLIYNDNFFEPDWLDPSKLIMKFGKNVTVALTMNDEVFEDSSAISKELSNSVTTSIIKEKIYVFDFNKRIVNVTPEGSTVEPNTILFTILDDDVSDNNLSEASINMLQNLSSLAPKAKYNGVIERYEIKYNGELSDMSPSLKKLAIKLDKQLFDETKTTQTEATNNRVNSEYRSEGKNLNIDTLELKVFIKINLAQDVGDKAVFASQMKSVNGSVFNYNMSTESGTKIDAMFSFKGILGRVVGSPLMIGTTNRLLKHVSKQAADIYFGK